MKKFIIAVIGALMLFSFSLNAYSTTGYDEYSSIEFTDEGKLLIDMTQSEIDDAYKNLGKRRFWGWKHHYINIKEEAVYIGETIFAKSNRSSQNLKIDYQLEEKTFTQRSIRTTGTLSAKFDTTIKKIDASIEAEVERESTNTDSITRVESTSFTITVKPNHRLIFRVTGDVLVTNGVSKYYVLGITFDKGCWEYIDVMTRYYELYEEEIRE